MQQLLLVVFLSHSYCSFSNAQVVNTNPTQNTQDLLEPNASNWSGQYGIGMWHGFGGPDPNRLPSDTGFVWSSGSNIVSTTIAINQALTQAGVQVNGFTYRWRVKNGNANLYGNQPGTDDFFINVDVYDSNGNIYASYQYDLSYQHNWSYHSGSETFVDPFLPPSYFSDIIVSAQGSDSAGWPGHYGPEFNVRASELKLTFSANPCHNNPLYDPQCQGYATALFNQQCTQNPLFDPTCPGYLDPVEKILSEPDVPVVAELDFTGTGNNTGGEVNVPEQQVVEVVEVEDGSGFQQVDDSIEGEQLQMEDDIEKEIAALESEASEDNTNAPDMIGGGANQEDDIEKELAELKESANSDNKKDAPKPKTRNEKIKLLLAMKAIELTKKLEKEVNLEQNMIMQRQLLALISYVPGFDYNEKKLPQVNFYPPKPTVDHAYARWFLNDPNFGAMEDSQYNFK